MKSQKPYRYLGQVIGLSVLYFITAKVGLHIAATNKFATLIWAPTGISIAVLLIFGLRLWPGVFLGALVVNFITGAPVFVACGIASGNTLEAILGAYLCSRSPSFDRSLSRLNDSVRLIVQAGFIGTLVSATIGVLSLWLGGLLSLSQTTPTWLHWWAGDAIGALTVAPLVLVLSSKSNCERFQWRRDDIFKNLTLLTFLISFSVFILSGFFHSEIVNLLGLKGIYILFPFLLWPCMRFGQRGSVIASFIVSAISILCAVNGEGPFSLYTAQGNPFPLIAFVTVITITSLIFGAVVTERELERETLKLRELELKRAKELADSANSSKSTFLANMSHEIRTPLGIVLGFSRILAQSKLTKSERERAILMIERNGRMLSNIIDDILDLSKVEAGKVEVEKISIPLKETVSELMTLLKATAAEKGLELIATFEKSLPLIIETDPTRLRQILFNIVGNAIKFTERGSIELQIKTIDANGAAKVGFVIKDNGSGMTPEQAKKIFTPFTQADPSTTRKFGGTGLGLTLSKKLAQALGGDVAVIETALNVGSTFLVTIDPGNPITSEMEKFGQNDFRNLQGLRILIVDDSPDNQYLLSWLLENAGAVTHVLGDGALAVQAARNGNFDIILMDLQMPIMDGFAATKALRDQGYRKPIVALTAHAMKEERRRCLENGFDAHLSKPIEIESLIQTIAQLTSVRKKTPLATDPTLN